MELIKENIQKKRQVWKTDTFYRKKWLFKDLLWLQDHVENLKVITDGYILDYGSDENSMWVDLKIIEGIPASKFEHTDEFIKKIYNFCLEQIERTQPYGHGDWVLSNIIVNGDKIEMVDWDNLSKHNKSMCMDKLHKDLRSAFGEKFDEVISNR